MSEEMNEKRFCHHCGTEVPADSLFCPKCGTKLLSFDTETAEETADDIAEVTEAAEPETEEPESP